jgi:hypothetical protein
MSQEYSVQSADIMFRKKLSSGLAEAFADIDQEVEGCWGRVRRGFMGWMMDPEKS